MKCWFLHKKIGSESLFLDGLLDAVYDITVGYPQTLPQSEFDILKGHFPEEVHFTIKR
jgi:hypothetical protein